ncbi:LysM peptidoglycan-binding domain-containing protein [Ilyomonas limi]|uniref:LysM peptidoglycan-binding domain-containing protein n=1 Tax=Ilyomonas limi TaxID=2575867 RepID=A0A4U3KXW2_9BACT|nr:LysM peptidoglycan-binding domain-containing protein [Ilyomonas limi]TKK65986.1 LysM peptidoglycan-binding domain-containing protein [Ilyomonas limi]
MKQGIFRAVYTVLFMLFLGASVQAQTAAYTLHTIAAGESLSGLAKEYHTTVGDIMRLNDMHADSKLKIGEKIKIPATSEPVQRATTTPAKTQTAAVSTTNKEALTHTVQSGESLYRISKTYNVSVEKLMSLNHLTNAGEIKVGQVLQISDGTPPPSAPAKTRAETAPATTAQQPATNTQQAPPVQPKQTPVTNTAPADNATSLPATPVQKQSNTPITTSSNTTSQVAQPAFASTTVAPKEGFFTAQFKQNVEGRSEQTKTGAAMTFKSASGWADKKFYILMNDAPPGSIVKVTNDNNVVYAKVLWSLGTQKENDGLDFRISTATAAALNISDEKFNVTVTYFQ